MKKKILLLVTFFLIAIIAIFVFLYNDIYLTSNANKHNKVFDKLDLEIYGAELISIINKATDSNESLNIQKNSDNKYIDDGKYSIKIDIKFLEKEEIIDMESVNKLGTEQFIRFYSNKKFKCTETKYHKKSKYVCYLKFEEIE